MPQQTEDFICAGCAAAGRAVRLLSLEAYLDHLEALHGGLIPHALQVLLDREASWLERQRRHRDLHRHRHEREESKPARLRVEWWPTNHLPNPFEERSSSMAGVVNLGSTISATDNIVDKQNNLVVNATQANPVWAVADTSIATVSQDADGVPTFTPVAPGSTIATVTADVTAPGFGPSSLTGSDTLTVVDTPTGLQIVWGQQAKV